MTADCRSRYQSPPPGWAPSAPGVDVLPGPQGLKVTGRLEASGDSYLPRADLRGVLATPCGRCLEPAEVSLDVPLIVSYVEGDEDDDDEPEEDEDGDVRSFLGGEIDFGPRRSATRSCWRSRSRPCAGSTAPASARCAAATATRSPGTCEADAAARSRRLGALADIKLLIPLIPAQR